MGRLRNITHRLLQPLRRHRSRPVGMTTSLASLISRSTTALNMSQCHLFSCCFGAGEVELEKTPQEVKVIPPEFPENVEEFEKDFIEFVDDLDLIGPSKAAMLGLPLQKKWLIYQTKELPLDSRITLSSPEYYVDRLANIMPLEQSNPLYTTLHTSLRTQPNHFITKFLSLGGLELLLSQLSPANSWAILKCTKSLMNNSKGRSYFLKEQTFLNQITEMILGDCVRTKVEVYEILGAVCLVPGGWRQVMGGVQWVEQVGEERARFLTILNDLDRSTGHYRTCIALKIGIMSFLNALIAYGPGEESLEYRLHLRYELLQLGMEPILRKLRRLENDTLDRHLDFFEGVWAEDEKEGPLASVDTLCTDSMFNFLKSKYCHGYETKYFKSLLRQLVVATQDSSITTPAFLHLLTSLATEISLQSDLEAYGLSTISPQIIDKCYDKLTNKEQVEEIREELKKARADLAGGKEELARKREELLRKDEELSKTRNEVERRRKEAENMVPMAPPPLLSTYQIVPREEPSPPKSPPRKNNAQLRPSPVIELIRSSPPSTPLAGGTGPPPPPPPPPPPLLPPLPAQKKATPTPPHPLKSLNWQLLPQIQIHNTIWSGLDESGVYEKLDLQGIQRIFASHTHTSGGAGSGGGVRRVALIDPRRSQNLTILLSKLKQSNGEICQILVTMETDIPVDMLEQLFRFLPTKEEVQLLGELSEDIELGRAEEFLKMVSKVASFELRLRALIFLKKYQNTADELTMKLRYISGACGEIRNSTKLPQLLTLVLALGNYLNRGCRGNCFGFKLESLNRLRDTKGRDGVNLLQFLVEEIMAKYEFLVDIGEELEGVGKCGKINLKELELEVATLESGVADVRAIFLSEKVVDNVSIVVTAVGKEFRTVWAELLKTTALFGHAEYQDFFVIWDEFLSSFNETLAEIKARRKQESDYATLKRPCGREEKTRRRDSSEKKVGPQPQENGEFDDLISALRTGDVFTDDHLKKRTPRSKRTSVSESRERIH